MIHILPHHTPIAHHTDVLIWWLTSFLVYTTNLQHNTPHTWYISSYTGLHFKSHRLPSRFFSKYIQMKVVRTALLAWVSHKYMHISSQQSHALSIVCNSSGRETILSAFRKCCPAVLPRWADPVFLSRSSVVSADLLFSPAVLDMYWKQSMTQKLSNTLPGSDRDREMSSPRKHHTAVYSLTQEKKKAVFQHHTTSVKNAEKEKYLFQPEIHFSICNWPF